MRYFGKQKEKEKDSEESLTKKMNSTRSELFLSLVDDKKSNGNGLMTGLKPEIGGIAISEGIGNTVIGYW